jgi:hypothetical protein
LDCGLHEPGTLWEWMFHMYVFFKSLIPNGLCGMFFGGAKSRAATMALAGAEISFSPEP